MAPILPKGASQMRAKIDDMEFQEADLAKELSEVQEVTVSILINWINLSSLIIS